MLKFKTAKAFVCAAAVACSALSYGIFGGVSALADASPDLCEVNGVSYRSFDEALANWQQGSTLKLLRDCSVADLQGTELDNTNGRPLDFDTISVTESKTLDLNGKTLKGTGTNSILRVTGKDVTFTLNDSSAEKSGALTGGSAVFGGAVYVANATFNMNGGKITGNRASSGGGIYLNEGTINLAGGSLEENSADFGGGVYLTGGTLNLPETTTVSITKNTAVYNGGGIYAFGLPDVATVNIGGGLIGENEAQVGGGVSVWGGGVLNLTAKGKIFGNHAVGGAGVYVFGNAVEGMQPTYGRFAMSGGELVSNVGGSAFGGGVKVGNYGVFTMSGGTVSQNVTEQNGGGVSIDYGGEARFESAATVKGNSLAGTTNNVYFADGSKLSLADNFSGEIGFFRMRFGEISENYHGKLDGITADDPDYEIYLSDGNLYLGSLVPVSLSVEKMPTKTDYESGEKPDLSGMVLKLVYKDSRQVEITDYDFDDTPLTEGNSVREITCTVNNVTLKTRIAFTVNGVGSSAGGSAPSGGKKVFPGGFIAVVVLSALFAVAFVIVGFVSHGFKGNQKKSG